MVWRRWAGLRPSGIDRICLAWQKRYGPISQATLFHKRGWHVLSLAASRKLYALLEQESPREQFRRNFIAWAARNFFDLLQSRHGSGRLWFNVGHTGLDLPHLADWVASAKVRPVLMLHDLIPITHPQFFREGEKARHEVRVETLLRIAHVVIGNSQDTLDQLRLYATQKGITGPLRTLVAWPGTPQLSSPVGSQTKPSDEFIILGTIEGRKNHALLLEVWARLYAQYGESAPRLVIIGRRGWVCDEVWTRLDKGGFGSRVVETGPLSDEEVAKRLAGARALLFPSFAEGYGLPLVEAMAAGIPVIASNIAVFREIGQGVPEILPYDDVSSWADMIMAYAAPYSLIRKAQIERLQNFRAPDWNQHFASVDAFLAESETNKPNFSDCPAPI